MRQSEWPWGSSWNRASCGEGHLGRFMDISAEWGLSLIQFSQSTIWLWDCVCVCARVLSHVPLFATPWTIAHEAALSMEISRQEYWSGLPFPSPEDLPSPGIKPMSLVSLAVAGWFFTTVSPGRPCGTSGQLIDSMTVFVTEESNQLSTSPNLKASLLNSLMAYGTSEH